MVIENYEPAPSYLRGRLSGGRWGRRVHAGRTITCLYYRLIRDRKIALPSGSCAKFLQSQCSQKPLLQRLSLAPMDPKHFLAQSLRHLYISNPNTEPERLNSLRKNLSRAPKKTLAINGASFFRGFFFFAIFKGKQTSH